MFNKLRKFLTTKKKKEWKKLDEEHGEHKKDIGDLKEKIRDLKEKIKDLEREVGNLKDKVGDADKGLERRVHVIEVKQGKLEGAQQGYNAGRGGR